MPTLGQGAPHVAAFLKNDSILSGGDCLLLAEGAKEIDRLDFYVEWREQAHTICQRNSRNCSATTEHLYMSAVLEVSVKNVSSLEMFHKEMHA